MVEQQPQFVKSTWLDVRVSAWKADSRAWIKRHAFDLWLLVGIWSVVSTLIFLLSTGHQSPRRFQDEFLFWAAAKNFAAGDGLSWRGQSAGLTYVLFLGPNLYPVLLAPAFWIGGSVAASYTLVHMMNSLMMVAVVFPVFLMARMFMDRWPALLAALFAVSVPAMNYAGIIGTESLAYPVAAAAFGAIILSVAKPRRRNWLLALAMIGLAGLTRAQFAVFVPIYILVLIFAGKLLDRPLQREYYRVQREPLAVLAAGCVAFGILFLIRGRSAVGLYQGVFDGLTPSVADVWYWLKALTADVYLMAGIVPVIATVAMVFNSKNRRDPLIGALLVVAFISSLAFVAEVTWFSATNPFDWRNRHIFYERYMFYLGPLFFVGFLAAWKRVSVGAALVSSVIAVLVVWGFQTDAVLVPFSYDSFGLSLVGRYMDAHPDVTPRIGTFLAGITAVLAVIYCISRLDRSMIAHYLGLVIVVLPMAILIGGQAQTWYYATLFSGDAFKGVPKPANFIDRNTDRDVGMIVTSTDSPEMYFTTEFWNDRLVRAFETEALPFQTPVMYSPRCPFDWDKTGAVLGTGCDKVPSALYVRNDTVSVHLKDEIKRAHPTAAYPNMTLMVAEPPARMLSIVDGRNVLSGKMPSTMNVRTFLDRPGTLSVRFGKEKFGRLVRVGRSGDVLLPAGKAGTITTAVKAHDTTTAVSAETLDGVPATVAVDRLDVRERGGRRVSIL